MNARLPKSVGEMIDRLSITNLKIWHLEEAIRQGREGELGLEEVGRRALEIRSLNAERVALVNGINVVLDPGAFPDRKVNHASGA